MRASIFVALPALAMTACAQGPYPTGRIVELSGTTIVTSQSFKITGGGAPVEQKGTIGAGDDCGDARSSAGKLTTRVEGRRTTHMEVVGQTRTGHPLLPGDDSFDPAWVSVVEATVTLEGKTTSIESFQGPSDWNETTETIDGKATNAATYALAADEYLVRLSSLGDLWKDLDDTGGEAEEQRDVQAELLTRRGAAEGELWPSLDGSRLYQAMGTESVETPAGKKAATRVDVHAVAPIDPTAASVLERCVSADPAHFDSTQSGARDVDTQQAHLDPGCESAFVHQTIGSEWWQNDVKVAEQATTWTVTVAEFGFESFDDVVGSCTRVVSTTKDDPDATLFVQYTVTTTESDDSLAVLTD